jgi:predicted amino acid-binding ACT domain protein
VAARAFSNSAWGANDALLVSVKGTDRPGITANLSQVFHEVGAEFIDADQAVVHQQLSLNFLLGMPDVGGGDIIKQILIRTKGMGIDVSLDVVNKNELMQTSSKTRKVRGGAAATASWTRGVSYAWGARANVSGTPPGATHTSIARPTNSPSPPLFFLQQQSYALTVLKPNLGFDVISALSGVAANHGFNIRKIESLHRVAATTGSGAEGEAGKTSAVDMIMEATDQVEHRRRARGGRGGGGGGRQVDVCRSAWLGGIPPPPSYVYLGFVVWGGASRMPSQCLSRLRPQTVLPLT